ncbi:uncharacterized protein LAJ45_03570 [Morchella importuna]|uniref:uncharacterized protein n=1 Tax=Morchella importuna TaxID=1174673 RepID=UPI001E8CF10F|nr:uncharacterized protein LAJ45_03570 [Morchella importuna]KAH8152144.1 hypothetical protein LAJ45_03570 [Morchella importuna]
MSHPSSSAGGPSDPRSPAARLAYISELIAQRDACEAALYAQCVAMDMFTRGLPPVVEQSKRFDIWKKRAETIVDTLEEFHESHVFDDSARGERLIQNAMGRKQWAESLLEDPRSLQSWAESELKKVKL